MKSRIKFRQLAAILFFMPAAFAGASAIQTEASFPDAQSFIAEFRQTLRRDGKLLANYTYTETDTETTLDSAGKPKKTETRVYQMIHGAEEWQDYRRLIEKDGKPLSAKDLAKQDGDEKDRMAKEERQRAGMTEKKRRDEQLKEERKEREIMDDVFALYEIRLLRRDNVEGRRAILVSYEPRSGYKPKTDEGKTLQHIGGRAWIAEEDHQLARLEAEVRDSISMGVGLFRLSKGSTLRFERSKIRDEIWLPVRAEVVVNGRLLLLKGINQRVVVEYSDHRKFSTETILTEGGPGSPVTAGSVR